MLYVLLRSDYASKHWSGLISDYYAARADLVWQLALQAAAAGEPLSSAVLARAEAALAYDWTNASNLYPTSPVGDAVAVSTAMYGKYAPYFKACSAV